MDDGAPLSLDHYHGIYIGLEKLKIVRAWHPACIASSFGLVWNVLQQLVKQPQSAAPLPPMLFLPAPTGAACSPYLQPLPSQAKQRVNVSKLVAPNYSGGYLLSYENDNIEAGAQQLEAGRSDWLRWQAQRVCAPASMRHAMTLATALAACLSECPRPGPPCRRRGRDVWAHHRLGSPLPGQVSCNAGLPLSGWQGGVVPGRALHGSSGIQSSAQSTAWKQPGGGSLPRGTGARLLCRDPKKNATSDALAWLKDYFQSFQDALEAPDWLRCGLRSGCVPSLISRVAHGCSCSPGAATQLQWRVRLLLQPCATLPRATAPRPCAAAPPATPASSMGLPGWTTSCSQRQAGQVDQAVLWLLSGTAIVAAVCQA